MGVPVITLFDSDKQYHVQNVTASILMNCGLSEYICFSEEEYIEKVCYYAENFNQQKSEIRAKFQENLYDNKEFVADFEEKLVNIYQEHVF